VLSAAVIGFGVGEQHARAYAADPRCRLAAICDIDGEKRLRAREVFPGVQVVDDPFTLLRRADIDIVSIASPDDAHYEQIVAALDAGKHVFVEKPVCLTQDELTDIRGRLARRPGLAFSSNLILRMSPRFRDFRERVLRGEIGRPYYLESDYCYGRIHKIIDGWRGRIPGYSVMLGGGVHVVDLLLWMTGGRVEEVSAFGNNICTADSGLGIDDMTVALLRFEGGELAKVSANFGCVRPHFHRLTVYGTAGTLDNEPDAARLWTSRDEGVRPDSLRTAYPGVEKGALIRNLLDVVIDGATPVVAPEDIFHTMSVCLAIDAAKAAGRPIQVARNRSITG
jgi:predicted dehydrogenase